MSKEIVRVVDGIEYSFTKENSNNVIKCKGCIAVGLFSLCGSLEDVCATKRNKVWEIKK